MRTLIPIVLLALCAAGSHVLRAEAAAHLRETRGYDPKDFVPDPSALRALSLGYDRALADLLWMRALVYVGEEFEHRSEGTAVFRHADGILALDPDFEAVYEWISVVGTYRLGDIHTDDYLRTIDYLRTAAERFRDDGEMRWTVGATMVFDQPPQLREEDPELSQRLELEGLEHVDYAVRHGAAPSWMVFATSSKLRELGRTEQAIESLREMYGLTDDPGVRRDIEERLAALEMESAWLARDAELEHLEQRHQATYPWVPVGLWILVDDPAADPDGLMGESGDAMLPGPDETDAQPE